MKPVAVVLAWVLLRLSSALAQETVEVSSAPACPGCRIEIERIVTLGSSDGPGAFPARPGPVARDSRGRFYVAFFDRTGEPPFVFDGQGRFLTRLGTEGEGPGEYEHPGVIAIGPGDTVHILDDEVGRWTVLSPSYALARTVPFPYFPRNLTVLGNGHILVNAPIFDADRIGKALHEFDPTGHPVRSFDEFAVTPSAPAEMRFVAMGRSGIWSVNMAYEYSVKLWSEKGGLEKILKRRSRWFPDYSAPYYATPRRPPAPLIAGLWEDDHGYVWVLGQRPDREWWRGLGKPKGAEGARYYPFLDWNKVYDGMLEVIDPAKGQLVTSLRMPDMGIWVVEPGLFEVDRQDERGWWYADVYRATIRESP